MGPTIITLAIVAVAFVFWNDRRHKRQVEAFDPDETRTIKKHDTGELITIPRYTEARLAGQNYRQDVVAQHVGISRCNLVPEPKNPHDPNAVRVEIPTLFGQHRIGYIAADETWKYSHLSTSLTAAHMVKIEQKVDLDDNPPRAYYTGTIYIDNK